VDDSDAPFSVADSRLRNALPAAASAALALVLFAVTLGGTYVYDDIFLVTEDPRLHDPSRWDEYWLSDYFAGGIDKLYRPLVSMSYAVQWQLHGDRPWAFHAVNWALHALASALVAELARRLSGARAAYVGGLLFAAHPVHVEAVANVVGRAELLCAAGSLGALVVLAKRPLTGRRALAVWACFVVALLSKEQGMVLPVLLALLAVFQFGGWPPRGPDAERRVIQWLVFAVCVTLAGYIVFRENTLRFWWDRNKLDWVMNPLVRSRGADRWLMPLSLLGRYTLLLVAPARLSIDYGAGVIGWQARPGDPYLWLGAAALATWLALSAWCAARRHWPALFCLLGVAATYGLAANLLTLIGTIFAERLMYLPSAFFVMLVGIGAARLRRGAAAGALAVLLVLGSLRTFTYARRWNDRLAFYEQSLREQPDSVQLCLLLSSDARVKGRLDLAEGAIARARRLAPDHWLVLNYSALVALERKDYDAAERYAGRSMELESNFPALAILDLVKERRAATQPSTGPGQ
jgi:protein O-mannosyl-transferase